MRNAGFTLQFGSFFVIIIRQVGLIFSSSQINISGNETNTQTETQFFPILLVITIC